MACLAQRAFLPPIFCVTGSPTQNGLLVITLCTDKVEKDKKIPGLMTGDGKIWRRGCA
ncbi:hypothetical protein KCP75_16905 [Salmonella enterica subsp. enterica]|nr:hypothetical protein KCP75_16905 [Salmonella enterica subsp. enterica]